MKRILLLAALAGSPAAFAYTPTNFAVTEARLAPSVTLPSPVRTPGVDELLFTTEILNIPYNSYVYTPSYQFPGGLAAPGLRVDLSGPACGGVQVAAVNVATMPNQVILQSLPRQADGSFQLAGANLYQIQFVLLQTAPVALSSCKLQVYSSANTSGSTTSAPDDQEVLIGVLHYTGGFAELSVPVATHERVTYFRAAVPAFCQGVEVLQAFSTTEGVRDQAQVIDQTSATFAVNSGYGDRISGLTFQLNGPTTTACDIPVYVGDQAALGR